MPSRYPLIGELALKYRTLTEKQLDPALALFEKERRLSAAASFSEILIREKLATQQQIDLLESIRAFMEQRADDEVFTRIAVFMGFITEEAAAAAFAEQARQFRELKLSRLVSEILVENGTMTPPQCRQVEANQKRAGAKGENSAETAGARGEGKLFRPVPKDAPLTDFEKAFLAARRKSEKFGTVAVRKGFVTGDQVDLALVHQLDEFKSTRKSRMIGDILVETGAMTAGQRDMILAAQRLALETPPEPAPPTQPGEKGIRVRVSPDGMKVHLFIAEAVAEPLTLAQIKEALAEKGVVHGILADAAIMHGFATSGLHRKPFLVAEGTPALAPSPPTVTCHFVSQNPGEGRGASRITTTPTVKAGALLADVTLGSQGKPGRTVHGGKALPKAPGSGRIRCGGGAQLCQDGQAIHATLSGHPFMSADGRIFVFADHRIAGDTRQEQFFTDYTGNIHASGTIGETCRIRGGDVSASEIRGATIDAMGNVRAAIGITGAVIRTEGSVRASYIRGSIIEAFGDVIVDNEIMDSEIRSGGICRVSKSFVIASFIAAKKGISLLAAGTPVSDPCTLRVGGDDHILSAVKRFETEMAERMERLGPLELETETLEDSLGPLDAKIGRLMNFFRKTAAAVEDATKKLKAAGAKGDPAMISQSAAQLKEHQDRHTQIRGALKALSEEKSGAGRRMAALGLTIAGTEERMEILCDRKKAFLRHAMQENGTCRIVVTGKVASGTVISGVHATHTLVDECANLEALEAEIEGAVPPAWEMRFSTKENKYI